MAGHALPLSKYFTASFPFLFLSFLSFIHQENKTHTIQLHLTSLTIPKYTFSIQTFTIQNVHYQSHQSKKAIIDSNQIMTHTNFQ